jgi:hypothetical protein
MRLKDWSDRLIWATILISVVRYAAAFAASDVGEITGIWSSILTGLLSFTGIGMGILDTVGGGLLFNGWSRVLPKHGASGSARFNILSVCVFILLASGLYILVPFTMSRLSHESVLTALGGMGSFWAWIWSLMVNLIPYVLIGGVFVGNKMVSSLEEEGTSGTTSRTNTKVSQDFRNTSGTTSKMGRPSIHQERVFSYMNDAYGKTGKTPTFTQLSSDLNLPQSTASRLRNEWINDKSK